MYLTKSMCVCEFREEEDDIPTLLRRYDATVRLQERKRVEYDNLLENYDAALAADSNYHAFYMVIMHKYEKVRTLALYVFDFIVPVPSRYLRMIATSTCTQLKEIEAKAEGMSKKLHAKLNSM